MASRSKKTTEPIAAAEAVKQARRQRWNPLRSLSPETLTRALDAFEYGDLREFALLAEVIADRDDTLKSVKPKREKATAAREWKIMKREKSPDAEKHEEVLKDFWQNVRAVNAYDRNERGGMARLIKQMMSSVSFRYAAHHIVWDPKPGKLRATFEFVPLWFFENREGKLRFLRDGMGITGEEMNPREWMVTCGDGLMLACAIDYLGKRYCMQDWLAFSEKFSMPGIMGATSAAKGSPEGLAMKSAVESFSQDWSAVMYGVTDPSKPPIHLIQPNGNPSAMPMPAYIERADRKMATLYMGADLSTMSSKDGQGTGASLQDDELDSLITDDCMTISETLQEVEREVIRWHFGDGVEPLAHIEVQPPVRVDKKFILEAITILTGMGVRLPVAEILDGLGFTEADADDAALGEQAKSPESRDQKPEGEEEAKRGDAEGAERNGEEDEKKAVENAYNPLQPRDPEGTNTGGRWTKGASTGKGSSAKRGEMREGTDADRKRLGVAPAFTNLQVTDDATADLLGTAKNAKGKTVYFYSEAYSKSQAAAKFARIGALHSAMPGLQAKVDEDILSGGPDREQALALRMITLTGLRNGGDDGGGKVETFGASNLRTDQVRVEGSKIHMDFPGKKGVRQRHSFTDDKLARHIADKQKSGAKQVFDGDAAKTLGYLKKISGDKFKVHDFRTWHGTMLADATAAKIAAKGEAPTTEKEFKIFRKRVGAVVGRQLGNDGAMSLKAYIHPQVFTPYEPKSGDSPRKKAA